MYAGMLRSLHVKEKFSALDLMIPLVLGQTFTHLCISLQVVNNILYSGSADMNVQAHNLSVSHHERSSK